MMSGEDIFDIVNEADEIIGAAPRSEVHARGLRHRAVHLWLYHSNGQILIQRRSPAKDRHPDTWDSSAAGHVDSGEDYLTAMARETREELGITEPLSFEEMTYVSPCEATGQEFIKLYRATHDGPLTPCPEEIAELRWISPADLEDWMRRSPEAFAPALPYLWNKLPSPAK